MANAPSVDEVTGGAARGAGAPADASEKVAAAIRSRGLARQSPAGDSAFSIKRKSVPDRLHPKLMSAYAALQSGDYATARTDYQAALRTDPRNRDAHLGLAAIAVAEGDWDTAADLYANLLRLNPRDSAAQAALISMQQNADPVRAESRIKLLLREEPQAAYLYFTLGNLYSDQGRWAEAQSVYFNAYRLQPENADYAYNLAVSLDQLSKSANAIDYYRRALELAANRRAAFEPATVLARIQSMSSGAGSQ
ncbi:MAG: tetratricopeptide repeat protein [Gammaproteobacteria bacterium]|nr:tetratricopeptide repeat protein [Gammaproteobacteria bacterium]